MITATILIIEDDPTLQRVLKDNFELEGFKVLAAADGEKGLEKALAAKPDLILLDLMLPKVNGYEICRYVRQEKLDMPIIMLTAKGQESDIVLGFNLGADDYVTKPFSMKELVARVHAFLRRRRVAQTSAYTFGEFKLDLSSRQLLKKGREIILTPKEFDVLAYLVKSSGRALTRDDILRSVWGHDILVTARSVDRCITTLRGKIEKAPANPAFIHTVRAIGYRFEGE